MEQKAIGIFDSGIGGLTILTELRKQLPGEFFIYLGDTKNFPYGEKSKQEIITFTKQNIEILLKKNVKLIIIACGTATSQALEEVKNSYPVPIIGIIEPTIEQMKKEGNNDTIGVMATEGTIKSNAWELEIKKQMPNTKVINKACPLLATMAEENREMEQIKKVIGEYMEPFKNTPINKLILGCTHYPIFNEWIAKELGKPVEMIDTSYSMAKYIKELLEKENNKNEGEQGSYQIFLTKNEETFGVMAERIFRIPKENIAKL